MVHLFSLIWAVLYNLTNAVQVHKLTFHETYGTIAVTVVLLLHPQLISGCSPWLYMRKFVEATSAEQNLQAKNKYPMPLRTMTSICFSHCNNLLVQRRYFILSPPQGSLYIDLGVRFRSGVVGNWCLTVYLNREKPYSKTQTLVLCTVNTSLKMCSQFAGKNRLC